MFEDFNSFDDFDGFGDGVFDESPLDSFSFMDCRYDNFAGSFDRVISVSEVEMENERFALGVMVFALALLLIMF